MSVTKEETKALRKRENKVDNGVLNFLAREEEYFSVVEIAEALGFRVEEVRKVLTSMMVRYLENLDALYLDTVEKDGVEYYTIKIKATREGR